MAHGGSAGQATQPAAMNNWPQVIQTFYPDWDHQTYCVPPIHFNRVPYDTQDVAGLRVLVQQPFGGASSSGSSSTPVSSPSSSQPSAPRSLSGEPLDSLRVLEQQFWGHYFALQPLFDEAEDALQQLSHFLGSESAAQPAPLNQPASSSQPGSAAQPAPLNQPASSSQPAPFALGSFSGEPARVQESDTRDDFAQQHVMHCVQTLGETQHEPMFVISQFNYADYLNKPAYAQAAQQLPRPVHLTQRDRDGDFDVLVVHLKHGVLIGEIKSVGIKFVPTDADVSKRVATAVEQLNKSERVVVHILQDIAPGVRIMKTLILPYITSQRLMGVLMADTQLQQALCATLGAPDVTTAVQLCLCADQLSDKAAPHHVTPQIMTQLSGWFTRRVSGTVDPAMTRDVYINMLARIVGPATTIAVHCVTPPRVEVRTLGEAVSELGERLSRMVLTPAQLSLITRARNLPRVCLVGPPGTGKSLVLVLVGLHWLRAGHDVLVLSTSALNLAVSHVIRCQLEMTLREDPTPSAGTVRFFHCELTKAGVDAAVQSVVATATLHILMDEALFVGLGAGLHLCQMVYELFLHVPGLSLWAASINYSDIPSILQLEALTVPLRSAPAIVREVEQAVSMSPSRIHGYTASAIPCPSDGPAIIRLRHEGGQHAGRWPIHCRQCGREVAHVLRHQLRVGVTGPVTSGSTPTSPPPLQYRDVLVLTRVVDFSDDVRDDEGNVVTPASGFVSGLRDAGIPVGVIAERDLSSIEAKLVDMVVVRTDQVNVTNFSVTHGLERKVVVCLPGRVPGDDKLSDEEIEAQDKLFIASRCSSQLVMVHVPPVAV